MGRLLLDQGPIKIPSEMEVAPRIKLLTLFTVDMAYTVNIVYTVDKWLRGLRGLSGTGVTKEARGKRGRGKQRGRGGQKG